MNIGIGKHSQDISHTWCKSQKKAKRDHSGQPKLSILLLPSDQQVKLNQGKTKSAR
jgi:hypothetical protein